MRKRSQSMRPGPSAAANAKARDRSKGLTQDRVQFLSETVSRLTRVRRQRALWLAEALLARVRPASDPEQLALAHRARAHALRCVHRWTEAREDYEKASALFRDLGKVYEEARTGLGLLDTLVYLNQSEEALDLGEQLKKTFLKHKAHQRLGRLSVNLGNIHQRLGEHQRALQEYDQAVDTFSEQHLKNDLAIAVFNQAHARYSLGLYDEALRGYEASSVAWKNDQMHAAFCESELARASTLFALGRPHEALVVLRSIEARDDVARDRGVRSACLLDMARMELALGQTREAKGHLEVLLPLLEELRLFPELAEAYLLRGALALREGDLSEATTCLSSALSCSEQTENALESWWIRLHQALVLRSEGKASLPLLQECREAFKAQGHAAYEAQALVILVETALESKPHLAAGFLAELEGTGVAEPKGTNPSEDWPWFQWKLWELRGRVAREHGDTQKAEAHFEKAYANLDGVRRSIPLESIRASFLEDKSSLYGHAIENAIHGGWLDLALRWADRARSRGLMDGLLQEGSRRETLDTKPQSRTAFTGHWQLYELRESLAPGEDLLQFHILGNRVLAFHLKEGNSPRIVTCPPDSATLRETLKRLRRVWDRYALGTRFMRRNRSQLRATADDLLEELFQGLLAPVFGETELPAGLVVVPHQFLHGVPFHAFKHKTGYVGANTQVRYAPSAEALIHCERAAQDRPLKGSLRAGLVVGCASDQAPSADTEARRVATYLQDPCLLQNEAAKKSAVLGKLPTASHVHLASHGFLQTNNALRSGVQLADGELCLADLYDVNTKARFAVLSACQTGEAVLWGGDELMGLV
ncbi:MAG: CHAT domain-containing protein, partial [Candidatus Eisenbacteria bacterium]|nr:CHAT domain-containing protein [Candidatus Eisenbacteria bacterium]